MKIVHIIPNLKKGGAERLALDICLELSKRNGIEVMLVIFKKDDDYSFMSNRLQVKHINSNVLPSLTHKSIVEISELCSFISEFKPDVIHSHLFYAEIITRWQLIEGIKYISHCHDNMPEFNNFSFRTLFSKRLLTSFYEKQILLRTYKKAKNTFISISKHTEVFFLDTLPKSFSKRIHLLPNAITFDRFNCMAKTNIAKSSTIKLVNVGLIIPKKNQQLLLSVIANIKARGFDVQLTILGSGYEFEKIKNLAQTMGIDQQVNMPGNVNNVEEYLSQNDIYVHSAYYEPFGLVLLEAMATGLPVVCLDGGGNRDIIENGKNGFIIKEQNVDEFTDRILELFHNKILYSQISEYAQKFAQQYDIKIYVDKLLEIYKNAPIYKNK